MKTIKHLALITVLALAACGGKKDENKPAAGSQQGSSQPAGSGSDNKMSGSNAGSGSGSADTKAAGSGSGSADTKAAGSGSGSADTAMAGSGSGSGSAAEPAADADYIEALVEHSPKKPADPVHVKFEKFTVTKATFDPKKIEGGTASIDVDLTSLKTGTDDRDKHLKSKAFFETETPKFAILKIDVADVKKKGDDKHYTANANVALHGVTKKIPVEFEVVDAKDDWIRVKGEAKVNRSDWKVGGKPSKDLPVSEDATFKLQLTLKKT